MSEPSKFGAAADAMNTINSDGKAHNGNYWAVGLAFGVIGIGVLYAIGAGIASLF